ncbi:MAG: T9SS type A sorting domain-containing protein [Bacteroidota bacterium]|nr:T9SS type A sorting domain-containing protein [Bacteroidota bacterium]
MSKLFTLLLSVLVTSSACYAGGNYDIRFKISFPDTLSLNAPVTVIDTFYNDGPDDFPGGTYDFYYSINTLSNSEKRDSGKKFTIVIPAIPKGGYAATKTKISKLEGSDYTHKDGSNIVIVWPTGNTFFDVDKSNDYYFDLNKFVNKSSALTNIAKLFGRSTTISVYPNPSTNNSYIQLVVPSNVTGKLNITNMLGQPISSRSISVAKGTPLNIDITTLPIGNYILTITSQTGEVYNGKIVKQ